MRRDVKDYRPPCYERMIRVKIEAMDALYTERDAECKRFKNPQQTSVVN